MFKKKLDVPAEQICWNSDGQMRKVDQTLRACELRLILWTETLTLKRLSSPWSGKKKHFSGTHFSFSIKGKKKKTKKKKTEEKNPHPNLPHVTPSFFIFLGGWGGGERILYQIQSYSLNKFTIFLHRETHALTKQGFIEVWCYLLLLLL